jgi:hypothetical protein
MFIEGYEHGKHLFPVCQNPGCSAGQLFGQTLSVQSSLDWRLNAPSPLATNDILLMNTGF